MSRKVVALFTVLLLVCGACTVSLAEEPVHISIGLRVSSDFNPEGNALCEAIEKATHTEIEWVVWPSSNWLEKRNVSLASNAYPDVIMLDERKNDNMYTSLVRAGKIIPLDEYIQNAENIKKYTLESAWVAQRDPDDGKMYTIPRCTIIREDFMMVRKDWMDKLGFTELKTVEDWVEFGKAVATEDPDGNGVNDTYLITARGGLGDYIQSYFPKAFRAYDGWYVQEDGSIVNGKYARDGRYKDVLSLYRQLYEVGAIDPEFLTYKGYYEDKFEQGTVAAFLAFVGNMDRELSNMRAFCPEAELVYVPYPEDAAQKRKNETEVLTNSGVYYSWAITDKGADRAQEVIDLFDWMLSDEGWEMLKYGVEGVHYDIVDGQRVYTDLYYAEQITANAQIMMFRRPLDQDFWLKKAVPEIYEEQLEWFDKTTNYIWNNYQIEGLLGFSATNEKEWKASDLITTEEPILIAEIITGEKPLEAWDEFIERVYASGYQEISDEYNAYFQVNQ